MNYINSNKVPLNKYSNGYLCLDYNEALKNSYAIRRKSPSNKYWWHGFNDKESMINFIKKNVNDGNETHEIICNDSELVKHKLFFDIDGDNIMFEKNSITFKKLLKLINLKVQMITGAVNPVILECHRSGKYSAHLIYDCVVLANHAKCIPYQVKEWLKGMLKHLGKDEELANCIDMGVYKSISSLRVMGSPKLSGNEKISPFIKNDGSSDFDPSTLINNYDANAKLHMCDTAHCHVKMQGMKKKVTFDLNEDAANSICGEIVRLFPQFTVSGVDGNLIKIKDDHTIECVICKRTHSNENPYALVGKNGSVTLICRRNESNPVIIIAGCGGEKKAEKNVTLKDLSSVFEVRKLLTEIDKTTIFKFMPEISPEMKIHKHIAISSPLGSGKTKALFDYIAMYGKFGVIISIVHRRSLTSNMRPKYKAAGFIIYDEIKGEIDLKKHKRILIQYESLHRLNLIGVKVNLLICDEVNSICIQYLSKMAKYNRGITECMFESICRGAERSIIMDGNLNNRILNAVSCLGQREYFTWMNEPADLLRPNIVLTTENASFVEEIIAKIRAGHKIEIVTSQGPKYCEILAKQLREIFPDIKILTIHSEAENKDESTADVEEEWVKYDCVIRSPVVGAGIDFSVRHFDYCFVDVNSGGPLADDMLQAMRRSRHIKSNTYYVHFGKCAVTKLPTTYDGVLKAAENNISHNLSDSMRPDFDGVINDGRFKFRDPDNPLLKFDIWCRVYRNKQQNNIMKRMMESFVRLGAKFTFLESVGEEKCNKLRQQTATMYEELKITDCVKTAGAPDLEKEQFAELVEKNKLTIAERYSVNKYIIRCNYKYSGTINSAWIEKYSDKQILDMNKHIAYRNVDINELAINSEKIMENMSDVGRMEKRKTNFMYKVAHKKIRDLYDKYNKTVDFAGEMAKYVNNEVKTHNPIYGVKELKDSNTKYVLKALNDVLMNLGYQIRNKGLYKRDGKIKKIYEFEWCDVAPNYYNMVDETEKDPLKPDFPIIKPHI